MANATQKIVRAERPAIQSHEDLEVFQIAYQLILETHRITLGFPKIEQFGLGDQMRRGSRSVCANLAEGHAKRILSAQEFKRFIMISYGSAEEMRLWYKLAYDLGYIDEIICRDMVDRYTSVGKMLYRLHQNWKSL